MPIGTVVDRQELVSASLKVIAHPQIPSPLHFKIVTHLQETLLWSQFR